MSNEWQMKRVNFEWWMMRTAEKDRDRFVIYRFWRRWCLLYGPVEYFAFELLYFMPCDVALLLPRSLLFLLYWYFCISGGSVSVDLLITKSSVRCSSDFSFASMARIVNSLLIFDDCDAPAASTGISTFVLGFSISSCEIRMENND